MYKGGNPATIKQLLQNQEISIVEELKNYFGTNDLDQLAVCLSNQKTDNGICRNLVKSDGIYEEVQR